MASIIAAVPKPIVVAVDDDARVRESLESLMDSAGYKTVVFASAEDCLQSDALQRAICVIADVRMRGMDGIELQRRIRLQRSQLPIIFISAHYEEEIREEALQGGAADFLYKPFDVTTLLAAIRQAVGRD
jgi:FixJ family two-component response regulator